MNRKFGCVRSDSLLFENCSTETLPCSLKNDGHIRWYIDGKVASTPGRQIKTSGDTLTINDIKVSDGGTYECRGLSYLKLFTIYVIGR